MEESFLAAFDVIISFLVFYLYPGVNNEDYLLSWSK